MFNTLKSIAMETATFASVGAIMGGSRALYLGFDVFSPRACPVNLNTIDSLFELEMLGERNPECVFRLKTPLVISEIASGAIIGGTIGLVISVGCRLLDNNLGSLVYPNL